MSDSLEEHVKNLEERIEELEKQNGIRKCGNCRNYYQHYVLSDGKFDPIYCGHCATPRIKGRKPDELACRYYEPKS